MPARVPAGLEGWLDLPPLSVVILSFYNCFSLSIVILSFFCVVILSFYNCCGSSIVIFSYCDLTTAVVCPLSFFCIVILSFDNCCSLSIVILSFFRVVILSFYNCCGLSIVIFSSPKFFVPKGSLPQVYPDCSNLLFSLCAITLPRIYPAF